MLAAVDPVRVVLGFLGASIPTMGFGVFLVLRGLSGWYRGSYPLTESINMTGIPARIAASCIILFGVAVFLSGLATLIFCCFRLTELLG